MYDDRKFYRNTVLDRTLLALTAVLTAVVFVRGMIGMV